MAAVALGVVLLSLVCSCAVATPSIYTYAAAFPGTQVPNQPPNPYNTILYLQNSSVSLLSSTNYTITSVYYVYQTQPTAFKGYLSPFVCSGYYAVTGLVAPSGMFFSVPNQAACTQAATPGTPINLADGGFAATFYAASWDLQAVNNGNLSLAISLGSEVRQFAGLPEATAFYCSGPCPAITVPGIVTALLSLLGDIRIFG